jgi:WS/DGAT/MGAT family acyltransferase
MGDILTPLDSLFLHLESPRTPMHAGSVGIFEGGPLTGPDGRVRIEELRDNIEARLALVPKLRQRVSPSPFFLLPRRWEDDPAFDITAHVLQAALPPPGSEEQLFEVCSEILSWPLDRRRPLWELWVVEGLRGGRVVLLEKVHHALSDGLGMVELSSVLLDTRRRPRSGSDRVPTWIAKRSPSIAELTAGDLASLADTAGRRALRQAASFGHPLTALRNARTVADGLRSLLTPGVVAPHCSINAAVGQHRRLAGVRQSRATLGAVQRWAGATLNDVLLAGVVGGIRALHEQWHEQLHDLQVLVPVGFDHGGDLRLGNSVSAMVVRLPLEEADHGAGLRRIAATTADYKRHHQADATAALLSALGIGLEPGVGAVARLVNRQPFVHLVVTNVPGPRDPLYVMGARMLEAFPFVPVAGNLSMGVAAFSYGDQLRIGILADRYGGPDVGVVARGMVRTFRTLVRAAGDGTPVTFRAEARPGRHAEPAGRAGRAS